MKEEKVSVYFVGSESVGDGRKGILNIAWRL